MGSLFRRQLLWQQSLFLLARIWYLGFRNSLKVSLNYSLRKREQAQGSAILPLLNHPWRNVLQNHLPLIRRMSSDRTSRLLTSLSMSLKSRDRQQTAVLITVENYWIFFTSSFRVCQRYHTIFNAAAEKRNCLCGFDSLVSSNRTIRKCS